MELSDYIRILRKNWLVIAALTLIGIGAASVFSLTRTPMYEATSEVFVSSQAGGTISELQQGSSFTESRMTTYVELVGTPIVLNPVISQLGLQNITASQLVQQVDATTPLNSTILRITVTNPDPVQAADIANAIGASLTAQVQELETLDNSDVSPVKLTRVKVADAPFVPVSPNVPLNLALGALVGLALGIGFAVLRTVLDTRIRNARDVEQITDRPIIGAIPFDTKAKSRPIILHDDPQNPRSEAFRSLRTNLQFLDMDGGHSFVVTSSVPSEGKSTTSVNLAIALAEAGQRVVLIDADLRKPKVHDYLGIEGGAGLTDVLIGRAHLADVMQKWGAHSLYVLPAGKIPPNPSELLGSRQMNEILDGFTRDVDVVILDAPPLLPVTDAAILARRTSGAIVIVAAGDTSRHQLEGAFDTLENVDAKIAGVVMTMMPTKGPDAYGYGYGYTYGYGYPQESKSTKSPKQARAPRQPSAHSRAESRSARRHAKAERERDERAQRAERDDASPTTARTSFDDLL